MAIENRVQRLFYETARGLERITEKDRALLRAIGVDADPFFKFTKGRHSLVVFAYKANGGRFVVKFKGPDDPAIDLIFAGILKDKGLALAEFKGNFDVSKKGLAYLRTDGQKEVEEQVVSYDKTVWAGYDFDIQATAAARLLEKCGYDLRSEAGIAAAGILRRVGRASGRAFGRLHKGGLLYTDFTSYNLAGDEVAHFFDIPQGSFKRNADIGKHLEVCASFFEYMEWYPEDARKKAILASILKDGFLEGLKHAEADNTLMRKVGESLSRWMKSFYKEGSGRA